MYSSIFSMVMLSPLLFTHRSSLLNTHTVLVGFRKRMAVPGSSRHSYAIQWPVEMQNFMMFFSFAFVDVFSVSEEGS
jgi:hypothetical protein